MNYNTKIQDKILKYHEMLKNNEDTTSIKSEIDAFTKEYIASLNNTLNQIREDKHVIEQKEIAHEIVDKNDYRILIELYRKSKDIMFEISEYKKHLRSLKGVDNE